MFFAEENSVGPMIIIIAWMYIITFGDRSNLLRSVCPKKPSNTKITKECKEVGQRCKNYANQFSSNWWFYKILCCTETCIHTTSMSARVFSMCVGVAKWESLLSFLFYLSFSHSPRLRRTSSSAKRRMKMKHSWRIATLLTCKLKFISKVIW